jgi:NACHT domain
MAEGLAVPASIIAVIQISDSVITHCRRFIGKVRGADTEIFQMINTVTALKGILEFLHGFVTHYENQARLPLLHSLCEPDGPLETCRKNLTIIETKLRPAKRDYSGALKAVTWPWISSHIDPLFEVLEKQKTLMLLAMQGDTTRTTLAIQDTVHTHVQHANRKEILKWLNRTDPATNHNAACKKKHDETGKWFLESREFSKWLLPNRSLWLHGIPGAGKTVLCSTIIENVKSRCPLHATCLYFYFDFNNSRQQVSINMLYSFLVQLSASAVSIEVRQLYERCNHGTQEATVTQLIETLLSIVQHEKRLYIIIDALDESSDWKELFNVIKTLLNSNKEINLLMTSRKEHHIQIALENAVDDIVAIQNERVDADIDSYVRQCLLNDPELGKWDDELKLEISARLTSKAHGM